MAELSEEKVEAVENTQVLKFFRGVCYCMRACAKIIGKRSIRASFSRHY